MVCCPEPSADTLVLPPAYCGGIGRYALMMRHAATVVDTSRQYDKRFKLPHRCMVADTRGPLQLTVPVARPERHHGTRWADMSVSRHGRWWDVHRTAVASAYGRTPFYEFISDGFNAIWNRFQDEGCDMSLMSLDESMEAEICRLLGIPAPVYSAVGAGSVSSGRYAADVGCDVVPYWQVRGHELGFIPDMCILDLIFNLGPEAPLYLAGIKPQF